MKFIINGGKSLSGTIQVMGFKNAAAPIIAATVLTGRICVLNNVPKITDVLRMLSILEKMGSKQRWIGEHALEIDNSQLKFRVLEGDDVSEIRSSILLIGPMLARFGQVEFVTPGGCKIGSRPIDTHIEAFADLGVSVEFNEKSGRYKMTASDKIGGEAWLKEFSVTATENMLMLGAKYPVKLRLAAIEPHVFDLVNFLNKLGAGIRSAEAHSFETNPIADGTSGKIEYAIMNDPIEAGTFAVLAASNRGDIRILRGVVQYFETPPRNP